MFKSLPILMYHSVSELQWNCSVSPEIFEEHCATLAKDGWRGISLAEAEAFFLKGRRLPRKTCLFSFDDGYLDNYVHAAPILRRYGHQGVIFPVLDFLEPNPAPRPDADDLAAFPELAKDLPRLDKRPAVARDGEKISTYHFCSRAEIRRLAEKGVLAPAPHSQRHDYVPCGPEFTNLHRPHGHRNAYSPARPAGLWGMPGFRQDFFLGVRGFIPAPALVELVGATVPQTWDAAAAFFKDPASQAALFSSIQALPSLGRLESDTEFRARLFVEFVACRERFEKEFGITPQSFCWPYGGYCQEALEEGQRAGFRLFFTTWAGFNTPIRALQARRFKAYPVSGREILDMTKFYSFAPMSVLFGKRRKQIWRERGDAAVDAYARRQA